MASRPPKRLPWDSAVSMARLESLLQHTHLEQ